MCTPVLKLLGRDGMHQLHPELTTHVIFYADIASFMFRSQRLCDRLRSNNYTLLHVELLIPCTLS